MKTRLRLNRRNFIKTGGASLATLAFLRTYRSEVAPQALTGSQRRIFPLNHNWLYSEKVLPGSTKPEFNDSRFVRVTIPHTDSTERKDIPPFGGEIDYLTFGGIYRDVGLRVVPSTFIQNVFAGGRDVLDTGRRLDVRCFLDNKGATLPRKLVVELRDVNRILATKELALPGAAPHYDLTLNDLPGIELWGPDTPKLYSVRVLLFEADRVIDHYITASRTYFASPSLPPDSTSRSAIRRKRSC